MIKFAKFAEMAQDVNNVRWQPLCNQYKDKARRYWTENTQCTTAHFGTGQFGSRRGGGGEHRQRVRVQPVGVIQHQHPRLDSEVGGVMRRGRQYGGRGGEGV